MCVSPLFSPLDARSLMLSFVIVTPAHPTRPQCVRFSDTYYAAMRISGHTRGHHCHVFDVVLA